MTTSPCSCERQTPTIDEHEGDGAKEKQLAENGDHGTMSPPKPGSYGKSAGHVHALRLSCEPTFKRTRTKSFTERIQSGPTLIGKVRWFCRQKGHGFVIPESGGDDLFFHITDVDGEFAPHDGDEVSYKLCPIPPKFEKYQASHIVIRNLAPGIKHERWSEAPTEHVHPHAEPNIQERRQSLTPADIEKLQHH